jgi:S-adenosylmethionine synthetase
MNVPANPTILRPAEWVLPGHPDKLADAIADAIVQAAHQRQSAALCGIEVAVHRDAVYLTGRLGCEGSKAIDLEAIVRGVYASAGYRERWHPAPERVRVGGNLCIDELVPGEEAIRHLSDDQSIVAGYANDLEAIGCLPPEHWLAREWARRLWALRTGPLQLCPDGKVLVLLEEGEGARCLRRASASLLAPDGTCEVALQRAALECLQAVQAEASRLIPGYVAGVPELVVNGGGNFLVGGPEGDSGLSGKKLLLDYYGPRVPIGGAALSGKDFNKPDRAGALIARRIALFVVRSGLAREATVTLLSLPGDAEPQVLRIATEHGDLPRPERWSSLLDCRFAAVRDGWRGVDLVEVARWGVGALLNAPIPTFPATPWPACDARTTRSAGCEVGRERTAASV